MLFGQRLGVRPRAVLIAISLLGTRGLAQGQQSPPPSASVPRKSQGYETQKNVPSDRTASSSCSLKVPAILPTSQSEERRPNQRSLTYTPLSAHCKLHVVVHESYSPYTFASAGFEATWAQATAQWPQYGGGMAGFGKRFGATLADTESRRFIQTFALSAILRQDPRYFPSCKKRLVSRAWYAATRVVTTRNDKGKSTFNSAEFFGALFASALQNSYYPRHYRTFDNTMGRFEGALTSDATSYALREFTPDLKRAFRKHAPKKVQQIEQKLPIPADDKP
jgi:hypothetical protein